MTPTRFQNVWRAWNDDWQITNSAITTSTAEGQILYTYTPPTPTTTNVVTYGTLNAAYPPSMAAVMTPPCVPVSGGLSQFWTYQQTEAEFEAMRRRAEEVEAAKKIANQNAERLLLAHLTPQQREQYQQHRYFEVFTARGRTVRRYRIHHGWAGNIQVFEGDRHIENLCIHPTTPVPHADNLLSQKFMLEADEDHFLKTANHHPAAAIRLAA